MIYSLIQFQSFCNPYNRSCYSERRNLRLLRTFQKIKLKIKWLCRKQISRQVVVSVILVYRCKEMHGTESPARPPTEINLEGGGRKQVRDRNLTAARLLFMLIYGNVILLFIEASL